MAGLTEAEYRALVDHSPVLVWRAGLDAGCDYFNETWLAFTGRTLEQELGDGWTEGVHPDDFERCLETYQRSFHARRAFEMEYRLRRHDGVYRYLFDRGVPFHDEAGAFAGFIGSCVDVHERVELDVSKARFLAMAAHELRTPLASVRTYLEVIARRAADGAVDLRSVDRAQGQLDRFNDLLGDLDDVAVIELRAAPGLAPDEVDLRAIVEDAVVAARDRCARARVVRHELVLTVEAGDYTMFADPLRLRQVDRNLVDNAIKYSPSGGQIGVRLAPDATGWRLTVEDHGIGVPGAEVARLGHRFYRASNAPPMNYPGLGLGLTLVREIVERHGGSLSVSSELGRGTAVAVTLPRAAGAGR